jgi:2-haloacid dehalogenase
MRRPLRPTGGKNRLNIFFGAGLGESTSRFLYAHARRWNLPANFAFSNGEADDLAVLLSAAGFDGVLDGIVSVHEVQSFKPDPAVYAFFLENTGALLGATWLVSGNPFDVIGSLEVGWKAAWVRRDPNLLFDPWGLEPTVIVSDLSELRGELV